MLYSVVDLLICDCSSPRTCMCIATQLYVETSHNMTGILRIPYNLKCLYTPDVNSFNMCMTLYLHIAT